MRKSFFDLSLSLEEDTTAIVDDAVASGGEEPVEATDVVEAEEETQELVETQQEAEEQVASLEEAEEVAEDLEGQLEEQEQIIEEKPEEVTDDTVQVAQEAMFISLARLGMKYEDIVSSRISFESNDSTPLQKFKVSTETLKDILNTIKEGIIKAVQAVINTIKKLWQKASIFFDRSEKTANKLIAEYKDASGNISADDALVKKVNAKFGGWFVATGKYDFNTILAFAKDIRVPKSLAGNDKDSVIKSFSGSLKSNSTLKAVVPADDQGNKPLVVYLFGGKVTYIANNDIKSAEVKVDGIDTGKAKSALNSLTVSIILQTLKKAEAAAKDMKKFQQDTFAGMDALLKSVKSAADNAKEGEGDKAKEKLAVLRKIGTKFALETVNQYIGAVNGTVSVCAALLKTTKKKEETK